MSFLYLLIINLLFFCLKHSRADDSYYTAGVVEFRPVVAGMSSSEMLADHLKGYLNILNSTAVNEIDIIVFPESTLNNPFHTTYVPSEQEQIIPCINNKDNMYADFLVQLSCAARRIKKYLVINLKEKANCPSNTDDARPCAVNKLNLFNTNVVFDREGRVVSRYRKVHVYVGNENTTLTPELAVFDTDFGVRFGHFICFDMLFYTPAQELVDRFAVTDFIFPTYFFSELPFLTAVQLQHGWAWGNNVNLLAAGASYPETGTTDSGIFAGKFGDLVSVMVSEKGERKLYKAKVSKKGSNFIPATTKKSIQHEQRDITKLRLLKDPQIQNYNSVLLDFKQNETYLKQNLCQGDVCCSFEIKAKTVNNSQVMKFKYRVGVFDGRRTYEKEEWSDIKVCALYTCANEQLSSCGEALTTENILFGSISIQGTFPKAKKLLIMPSILNDQLYPLYYNTIEWSKEQKSNYYAVNLKLVQHQTNILTFGVYAHYYEKSMALTPKPSSITSFTFLILIAVRYL